MQKYVPGLGGCCALPACGEGRRAGEQLPSFRRFHHRQVLRPPETGWVGHGACIPQESPRVRQPRLSLREMQQPPAGRALGTAVAASLLLSRVSADRAVAGLCVNGARRERCCGKQGQNSLPR